MHLLLSAVCSLRFMVLHLVHFRLFSWHLFLFHSINDAAPLVADPQTDQGQGLGAIDDDGQSSRLTAPAAAPRPQQGRHDAARGFQAGQGAFSLPKPSLALQLSTQWFPTVLVNLIKPIHRLIL